MAIKLNIYRGNNILLSDVPITETATHKATLMKEDYIKLPFYASENYSFKSGDYIRISFKDGEYSQDSKGIVYALGSDYFPTMDNEAVYKYELQFNACWYNLSQYQFFFLTETPNGEATYVTRRESEWNFTGTASELATLIIKNTRLLGLYNEKFTLVSTRSCPCKLDSIFYCEPTEVKSFSFSSTDIISALNQIAKEFELEWWIEYVDGVYRLHIGECDNSIIYESDNTTKFNPDGSRAKDETKVLPLIMGKNVTKPTVKLNSDIKRYFFVYGSSRNIDQTVTDLDVNAIATKRLTLNNPIDKGVGSGEAVLIFDDIYPKSNYQITRVDSYETQSDTIIGYESNGNPKYLTYTIYQIYVKAFSDMVMDTIASDADVQNIEDMVASGKKLSVKFITHATTSTTITPLLAGWEFEVGAVLKTDSTGKSWYELQIIHQEINDFIVPNANLRPVGKESGTATDIKGNKTTIEGVGDNADWICVFNIKGAYIKPEQSASAKQELQKAFDKYYANLKKNVSYTIAPYSDSKIFANLGDAINLQYGDNQVITRVNGFTRHLDYPIDASYELCSYTNTGAVNSLKDDVKVLNAVVNRMSGGGSVDANVVTDLINAFGKKHFLSKDTEDTAAKKITLAGGAVTDHLTSTTYTSGFGGKGYEIKMEDGESYLTVDNAYIRNKATFDELEIREVTHTGGVEIKSPVSCTIAEVALYYPSVPFVDADGNEFFASDGQFLVLSSTASGYKCYFKASDGEKTIYNDWRVGDLALCHEFNLASGSRYYHRRVLAVSAEPEDGYHWVALSETDAQGTDTPIKGDKIVCFGSSIKDRQNAIVLASNGENAPYFAQLKGLDSFAISEENYITLLSPRKNIIKGHEIILMSESGDKNVGDEIETTKAALSVQADRISSVVSEYEGLVKQYGYADFTIKCGWLADTWITNAQGNNIGSPIGYEKDTACQLMILTNVEKGDAIRIVPNTTTQIAVVQIYGTDGDSRGAEQDAFNLIGEDVKNYTWYGRSTTLLNNFDIDVDGSAEYPIPVDCHEVHIWLSDDWSEKSKIQVFHIKAKISAQSRIDQTADNIRLQVGEAGINLDSKVITLDASKTIVTGDLAVRTVKTYWDAEQTKLKSAYNGNGEGTIVYYYPNGQIMKEDKFVSDTSGNIVGMRTTYYKANGEVAWVIDEGGFLTTLPDYWEVLNNGNKMCYSDSEASMMDILTQYLGESMTYFSKDKFSRFVGKSQQYKDYNGKVSMAVRSSEAPTDAMLWAGVLVYSVELYKDGWNPTYIVTYEVCTTALGQVGAIVTKRFNSLGEIN